MESRVPAYGGGHGRIWSQARAWSEKKEEGGD
jgi:hypothetical protein